MKIALYKGRTRLFNRVVSWWTRSIYSHCEVLFDYSETTKKHWCASSSFLDGGVRFKWIELDPDNWDIVDIEADEASVKEWFANHIGLRYDLQGMIACVFRFLPASDTRWFCSSAIAAALGWPEPWRALPASIGNATTIIKGLQHG